MTKEEVSGYFNILLALIVFLMLCFVFTCGVYFGSRLELNLFS